MVARRRLRRLRQVLRASHDHGPAHTCDLVEPAHPVPLVAACCERVRADRDRAKAGSIRFSLHALRRQHSTMRQLREPAGDVPRLSSAAAGSTVARALRGVRVPRAAGRVARSGGRAKRSSGRRRRAARGNRAAAGTAIEGRIRGRVGVELRASLVRGVIRAESMEPLVGRAAVSRSTRTISGRRGRAAICLPTSATSRNYSSSLMVESCSMGDSPERLLGAGRGKSWRVGTAVRAGRCPVTACE